MKRRSAKQKGKRAVFETRDLLLAHANHLTEEDIQKPIGSRKGADLVFSTKAKETYPFTVEVKNQERLNIWEALEQSETHCAETELKPLLVFRRNHSPLYVTLRFEDFLKMIRAVEATVPGEKLPEITLVT